MTEKNDVEFLLKDREFMGFIKYVNPQYIYIHLPSFKLLHRDRNDKVLIERARIGDYLMIEGVDSSYLGKVLEVDTPFHEREKLNTENLEKDHLQLSVKAEILLGFRDDDNPLPTKGVMCYPCIGDKAYYASRIVVDGFFKSFGLKYNKGYAHINLGRSTDQLGLPIRVSLQSLFSRHCAIVGTTGGGKSWTIAKLIGEMNKKDSAKIILIDPTGEFKSIEDENFTSVSVGNTTFFHYKSLTIEDLYYLIKPSGNIQMPKLLEAIRSLKALELDLTGQLQEYLLNGSLRKANRKKEAFEQFYFENIDKIEDGLLNFDIKFLSTQITNECIFDTDKNHPEKYGNRNEEAVSMCFNLISRTSNLLHTEVFQKAFGFNEDVYSNKEMTKIIERFLISDKKVLRIGFEGIGFEFQAREIIANAIGKYLLMKARNDTFKENPVVIFIDEAHQFMNKSVVDDYFQGLSLTAFDQIAKECRKYGLFMCIATQTPRDIPVGTLSQMGTFIVHRLINQVDKSAIAEACSSATSNILEFLPILGEGEAILTGVDFPMDITIRIDPPDMKPDSGTPNLSYNNKAKTNG